MAHVNIRGRLPILGGEIEFNFEADNVALPNEMYKAAGYAAGGAVTTLAILYGFRCLKPLIEGAIERAFAVADEEIQQIFTGSLHVVLQCSTAERFLEILADYESGKTKERLEKELSKLNFKVDGLKVEIENMEKVKKRKKAIEIERLNQKVTEWVQADETSPPEKMAGTRGGNIKFIILADNVELSEQLRKYAKYDAAGGAATLAAMYGYKFLVPLIREVITEAFGSDDKEDPQISIGSSLVQLNCFTNEKFLKVLNDYESGKIKKRLTEKFSEFGFTVEGLKVETENMEEVNEKKEVIKRFKSPRIIVQGGVYRSMPAEKKEKYITATIKSAKTGYAMLTKGHTAVEAAEAAVCVLENDENFNAGCGSFLNNKGEVECDAMIMDGHTLKNGAVISGRHFRNPVSLAKVIMEKSYECALSGDGALSFAREQNFPTCEPEELITEHTKKHNEKESTDTASEKTATVCQEDYEHSTMRQAEQQETSSETVSAVAMDASGHFACAMSTGGLLHSPKGSVSDAAMVGCGGYANETGAATVTGLGESIIKVTLAREVVFSMEKGQDAQQSVEDSLKKMKERTKSSGGVIAIDKDGNFGMHFTTNMMTWASIKEDKLQFGMHENDVNEVDCPPTKQNKL